MKSLIYVSIVAVIYSCSRNVQSLKCQHICDLLLKDCDTLQINDTVLQYSGINKYPIDVKDIKGKRIGRYLYFDSAYIEVNKEIRMYDVSNRELYIGKTIYRNQCQGYSIMEKSVRNKLLNYIIDEQNK